MSSVFVGNLAPGTTADAVSEHFAPHGAIDNALVAATADGASCYATLRFADAAGADAALELHGTDFEGRPLRVRIERKAAPLTLWAPLVLWASQLPEGTTKDELTAYFATVGGVKSIELFAEGGAARQQAYVTFKLAECLTAALELARTASFRAGHMIVLQPAKHRSQDDKAARARGEGSRLFLTNLPDTVFEREVKKLFKDVGAVKHIVFGAKGGKKFAFVYFEDASVTEAAARHARQQMMRGQQLHAEVGITKVEREHNKDKNKGKRCTRCERLGHISRYCPSGSGGAGGAGGGQRDREDGGFGGDDGAPALQRPRTEDDGEQQPPRREPIEQHQRFE
jgi:polyadenylate-binding protein